MPNNKKNKNKDKQNNQPPKGYDKNPNKGGESKGKPYQPKDGEMHDKNRPISTYPNDPLFYAKDENMLRLLANFNWSDGLTDISLGGAEVSIPGIMALDFTPTFGHMQEKLESPVTQAADSFFNYLTQGYTGSVNFEAPDLFMHVLAAEWIYIKILEGKRMLKTLKWASVFNRYLPRVLLQAMKWDYDDLKDKTADFTAALDIRIEQINKWFAVPLGFKIGSRWEYLVSRIFTDTVSVDKPQFYVYNPGEGYTIDVTSVTTGTALKLYRPEDIEIRDLRSMEDYFKELDWLISNLRSQDTNNIFGALKRVYSEDQLKKVTPCDDVGLEPTYDTISLMQIHNARVDIMLDSYIPNGLLYEKVEGRDDNTFTNKGRFLMYQEDGFIKTKPMSSTSGNNTSYDEFVDVLADGYPGPAVFIETTANIQVYDKQEMVYQYDPDTETGTLDARVNCYCRCDVIIAARTYALENGVVVTHTLSTALRSSGEFTAAAPRLEYFKTLSALWSFNYAPMAFLHDGDRIYPLGEVTNCGAIAKEKLKKLHAQTFFTLLDMPANTKSVTK